MTNRYLPGQYKYGLFTKIMSSNLNSKSKILRLASLYQENQSLCFLENEVFLYLLEVRPYVRTSVRTRHLAFDR